METKQATEAVSSVLKKMMAIAGLAAMLSMSQFALAQSSGSGSTDGASSTSSATSSQGTSSTNGSATTNGASSSAAKKQGGSAATDMHSAMQPSDQQMKSIQPTGNIDRDYAMMMRAHHQGAVDMSQAVLANGKDPEIKRMARKIMNNNKKEIAQFDKWLNKQKDSKGKATE